MCRSRDAYIGLPVEKYELVSARGFAFTTRAIAARTAGLLVTSLVDEWKTTTFGGRTPGPECLQRPLPGFVGRLARNRGALVPARRELAGRHAADEGQQDPDDDHRPAVAGREAAETGEPTLRVAEGAGALSFHADSSRTATWTPDGVAVRVFSRVAPASVGVRPVEPRRQSFVATSRR